MLSMVLMTRMPTATRMMALTVLPVNASPTATGTQTSPGAERGDEGGEEGDRAEQKGTRDPEGEVGDGADDGLGGAGEADADDQTAAGLVEGRVQPIRGGARRAAGDRGSTPTGARRP
jgi:hypothetical protein